MGTTRRRFLHGAAALGVLPVARYVGGCGDGDSGEVLGPQDLFQHGVASGDPLTDRVILWTRVTPSEEQGVAVDYEVAEDPAFETLTTSGSFDTSAERDYTVKVDVTGLSAGTTYYYRFMAQSRTSVVGRTRTAPEGSVARLRLGVMSCSNYAFGHFHAYRHAAEQADLDAIIHLGDYIYEYGDGEYGSARSLQPPHEIVTLSDYRTRYAHYRLDPDLQAVHQQHPFIAVWDDHELTNDAWTGGAENHDAGEGDFAERRAIAAQVYDEWMPIRSVTDGKIFRRFQYGDLLDLLMLDTRLWGRQEQSPDPDTIADSARTLLGDDQEQWLTDQLAASTARWCFLGQQIVMAELRPTATSPVLNPDGWDGYPAARARVFDAIEANRPDDVIVLTGDIHASAAAELTRAPFDADAYDPDTGEGSLAVELVTPGVTSPFLAPELAQLVAAGNPQIKWVDGADRGYMLLDVTAERVQADWYLYADPEPAVVDVEFAKGFTVTAGRPQLSEVDTPVASATDTPELAPVEA